jgi:acyl-CoA synthetase (NDP forming)
MLAQDQTPVSPEQSILPHIRRMLSPRSVAVVGASSDAHGLRGRIMQVMMGHAYAGKTYPVSRSESEVRGLKAYRSVSELPETPDVAVLIIPAKFVPQELERCGQAGIKAVLILSSGFAEEGSPEGLRLQDEVCAIARRYGMAVNGPNSEGFANTAAALCPTFSPVMEADGTPLLPPDAAARGQVAVIAQSGGMGFAFYDRGRSRNLAFNHIMTTGNEACLETFDYVEAMLEEGGTDAFLLLLEDIKNPETFRRVAAKALAAGKPIIVSKIGQSEAGARAAAAHTAAKAGRYEDYQALFEKFGVIEGRDIDEMVDIAAAFMAFGKCLPAGKRVGICTASGGGAGWLADACVGAGLELPLLDAETRAKLDIHLPAYGTSQNPVDGTAQAIFSLGYAELARLVASSPLIDGVMVVASTRRAHTLERDREALTTLARETAKPIFFWSYTQVAPESMAVLSAAGYPLFANMHNCARAMRLMADYRAARERVA